MLETETDCQTNCFKPVVWQWEYSKDSLCWVDYKQETVKLIEDAFLKGEEELVIDNVEAHTNEAHIKLQINLKKMSQTVAHTRKIRRIAIVK